MNYRMADIHDVLPITLLWAKMVEEIFDEFTKLDKVELDKISFLICDRLRMPNTYTAVVEEDNKVIGFLHGYILDKTYGKPEKVGFCETRYIMPDYRGRLDIAQTMIDDFISWANELNVFDGEFIIPYSERLEKVYERMGYKSYAVIMRGDKHGRRIRNGMG